MAGKGEIRTGALVNWEGISEDLKAPEFRGLNPDYQKERHKKELRERYKDLELGSISNDILSISHRSNTGSYYESEFISKRLLYPFVEKGEITQMHDCVEELIGKKSLSSIIGKKIDQWDREVMRLHSQLVDGRIDFLTYERKRLENYSVLSEAVVEADSRLFKDLGDVFDSWNWEESPAGGYYHIINSPNIRAKVDINGFELFPENKDISLDYSNKKSFTPGDKIAQICMKESIQRKKANKVLENSVNLLYFLKSVALWSKNYNFVRPSLNKNGDLEVKQGYHPLLVSKRREGNGRVVKHDTKMNKDTRVLAVTGPNLAGKTTYIKELALMSLLAQTGCFVPADYANVPVYRRFLTHFGSKDDLMNNLSLFEAEIKDINNNLNRLKKGTLLVCDELFRGTESGEQGGARLHKALVDSLVYDFSGRTLLSSHYHESLEEQRDVSQIQFSRLGMNGDSEPDYMVREGIDKGGYAVKAAIKAGLSKKVCERLK